MITPSAEVASFLRSHREEVNSWVRARSTPGLPLDEALNLGLSWMEVFLNSVGSPSLVPLELALELADQGLLREGSVNLAPVELWIASFPGALGNRPRDVLVDWVHLLLRLRGHAEVLSRLQTWLRRVHGAELGRPEVRALLTALAWMAGMASWRTVGLHSLAQLPPVVQGSITKVAAEKELKEFLALQSASPLGSMPWTRLLGGVRGLSGDWQRPPQLLTREGRLYVRETNRVWELIADEFGAQCVLSQESINEMQSATPSRWSASSAGLKGPSGSLYPFPFADPPVLKGIELSSGLAAVVSEGFFSVILLYRGQP